MQMICPKCLIDKKIPNDTLADIIDYIEIENMEWTSLQKEVNRISEQLAKNSEIKIQTFREDLAEAINKSSSLK